MHLDAGARLGPYEIVSRLGAGGMGEVYRARDTRLDRVVALKVLPADRAANTEARARFEREARAIAALNHPNICSIHDVGLAEPGSGVPPYLVMELLEGETLHQRLTRGPLDLAQLVQYGTALADGLDAAHARGLIHRDLKPANIFITSRGVLKILDFGLAKAVLDPAYDVTHQADEPLTGLGTTVGTVAYMSPEQLRGEPLDVRSDLFSLGIVLYEMATGQRAFSGSTSAVVSAAILGQEPAAPRLSRPDLPARLDETILKALEKDRDLRCQSAAELRADLARVRRGDGSSQTRLAGVPLPVGVDVGHGGTRAPEAATHGTAGPTGAVAAATTAAAGRGRSMMVGLALIAVAGVAILGGGYWLGLGRGEVVPAAAGDRRPPVEGADAAGRSGPPVGTAAPASEPQASPSRAGSVTPPVPPPPPVTPPPVPPPVTARPVTGAAVPSPGPAPTQPAQRAAPSLPPTGAVPNQEPPAVPGRPGAAGLSANRGSMPLPGARAGRGRGGRRQIGPAGAALIAGLKTLPPLTFELLLPAGDEEAAALGDQLRTALAGAGWTHASSAEMVNQNAGLLVVVPRSMPGASFLVNWARRNGFLAELRQNPALRVVRIIIGRSPSRLRPPILSPQIINSQSHAEISELR